MCNSQLTELGARLEQTLTILAPHAQRWTHSHWRIGQGCLQVDVEVDETSRQLILTSSRLCIVPANLRFAVAQMCDEHNQGRSGFEMKLDGGDLHCRIQYELDGHDALNPQFLGQLLVQIEQGGRDFVDRLLRRCADDLLIRIHHQLENDHDRPPPCPA